MKGPFCIVADNDGHWYVIQSKRQEQWERFLKSRACDDGIEPVWAQRIDGPGSIDFIDYTERV